MKRILFFIFATILLLASCNDPELEEQKRLIGEWMRLDTSSPSSVVITHDSILISGNVNYAYLWIEPGKLYLTRMHGWGSSSGEEHWYPLEIIGSYWFTHDTLTLTNVIYRGFDMSNGSVTLIKSK